MPAHMPVGHHIGKITATALGTTDKGTAQLAVSMVNERGEFATSYLYFSDRALEWTRKQLKACGWTGDDVSELHDSNLLVGNKVEFDVSMEEYDGKQTLKVGMLFPEGGSGVLSNKMTPQEAKEFGARLRGRFAGASGDSGVEGSLDDIPF